MEMEIWKVLTVLATLVLVSSVVLGATSVDLYQTGFEDYSIPNWMKKKGNEIFKLENGVNVYLRGDDMEGTNNYYNLSYFENTFTHVRYSPYYLDKEYQEIRKLGTEMIVGLEDGNITKVNNIFIRAYPYANRSWWKISTDGGYGTFTYFVKTGAGDSNAICEIRIEFYSQSSGADWIYHSNVYLTYLKDENGTLGTINIYSESVTNDYQNLTHRYRIKISIEPRDSDTLVEVSVTPYSPEVKDTVTRTVTATKIWKVLYGHYYYMNSDALNTTKFIIFKYGDAVCPNPPEYSYLDDVAMLITYYKEEAGGGGVGKEKEKGILDYIMDNILLIIITVILVATAIFFWRMKRR